MITNTLNISPFFDPVKANSRRLSNYYLLGTATLATVMAGFLYNNFTISTIYARQQVFGLAVGLFLYVSLVFVAIGDYELIEGAIEPLFKQES
jgi:hypothetical protein